MPIICPIVRTCASKISKVVRESIPWQVDKKSGDIEEEKGAVHSESLGLVPLLHPGLSSNPTGSPKAGTQAGLCSGPSVMGCFESGSPGLVILSVPV